MTSVRLAAAPDAPALAALIGEFRDWWGYQEPSDESLALSVPRLLADDRTEFLLGVAADGEPAGVCQLRYRPGLWADAEDCELEDLFVTERARGSGLGRALAEAALARARARGCARVQLDTNEANAPAVALYESLGFSAWFDPPGGRNLNMRLRL